MPAEADAAVRRQWAIVPRIAGAFRPGYAEPPVMEERVLQQIVRYEIIFPPQEPLIVHDQLRFSATLYLHDIDADAFRRLADSHSHAVEHRVSPLSSDAAPTFTGNAELGHSFGSNDISLTLVLPSSAIACGKPHVLAVACIAAAGPAVAQGSSPACLALCRQDGGWA